MEQETQLELEVLRDSVKDTLELINNDPQKPLYTVSNETFLAIQNLHQLVNQEVSLAE